MASGKEVIKILHLEDNKDDVELLDIALKRSKLNCQLNSIQTKGEFVKMSLTEYDILVTDYNLKDYDGLSAIQYVRSKSPDIPIIILSGTVGEEMAVDLLRSGANDFILKSNLKKVPLAIERALRETSINYERKKFQKELVEKNLILDTIFDTSGDQIFLKDADGRYLKVNRAFCEYVQLHEAEIIGKTDYDLFPKEVADRATENDEFARLSGNPVTYEIEVKTTGQRTIFEINKRPLVIDGEVTGIVGKCLDITANKLLLEDVIKSKSILSQAERLTRSGSFEYDADLDLINCSSHLKHILRLQIEGDTISFRKLAQMVKEDDREIFNEGVNAAIDNYEEYHNEHRFVIRSNNELVVRYFKIVLRPDYKHDKGGRFYGTIVDVTAEHENQIYLMEKQERDRKELARELHDNLGQKMNGISMYISKISDDIPDNKDLKKVKALAHETIDDLGYLINNISVKQIEEHSLEYAIDKLISYLPEKMKVNKIFDVKEDQLSPFVKSQVYRVIQEVLNNTVKYSEASKVDLTLQQDGGILSLNIGDNGKGFVVEKVLNGNGLQNITHRVRRSNGLINIDSAIGKGTRIIVKMPIS
ncbi:PAS domain-containing protein [Ekhidna sp.]|uniref:PAS domain-containing sensor histidine kinase n=1 Tax=Ekhidna sp. TaxID=2608089 RepID=UPI003CCC2A79